MTKYEIILYWSNEDEAFIAEVSRLADAGTLGNVRIWTVSSGDGTKALL